MKTVGARIKEVRRQQAKSRRELSEQSGVSTRYLAQLESGDGNISIGLLQRIAIALDSNIEDLLSQDSNLATETSEVSDLYESADPATRTRVLQLLDPDRIREQRCGRICLVGLRGAGKSTLGALVAKELGVPFVELNSRIESMAGMPTAEIIALYGQEGFRELESSALNEVVESRTQVILAVAGGIVAEMATYQSLLLNFHTIWLKASPSEHMERVREQGDLRPMKDNPRAMVQLLQILRNREAEYERAGYELDTSGRSLEASATDLKDLILRNRLTIESE